MCRRHFPYMYTVLASLKTGNKSHKSLRLYAASGLGVYLHNSLFLMVFCGFWLASIAFPSASHAQAIDSMDLQRRGTGEAEIVIRFSTQVQYLRHAPRDVGNSVRIYVLLTGGGLQPSDLLPQSKRLPREDSLPQATVSFPELDNSVLVSFDQSVRFSVTPGPDGRSILVRFSLSTGK